MKHDELVACLNSGKAVGLNRHTLKIHPEVSFRAAVLVRKLVPDPPGLYPERFLQEEPSYTLEQKIIALKPLRVSLLGVIEPMDDTTMPKLGNEFMHIVGLGEQVDIYYSHLEEVAEFLQQFNRSVDDLVPASEIGLSE